MTERWILQFWDPKGKKYRDGWNGTDFVMAAKMFDKPYNRIHTRRLVRVQTLVARTAKAEKR